MTGLGMVVFLWFKLWNCYSRSISWGIVTVFQFILSRKSKHSFNLYQYSKLSQGNNSTNQPIPVNEGFFINDYTLKVITGEGGYFFKPMSIPLKWSRQVADRAGRFVLALPNGLDVRGENPFTVTVWKSWRKCCLRIF